MRLGIVVNTLQPKDPGTTTYCIAREAVNRGHEVWLTTTGRMSYAVDDRIVVSARTVPSSKKYSMARFMRAFQSDAAIRETIAISDLDVLLLRNNPTAQQEWVQSAMLQFAKFASERDVVVLPSPEGLATAANKLYLNNFPRNIRPRTLVTRSFEGIVDMLHDEGTIILKPLAGYGGRGVFIVHKKDPGNLDRMVQSISRDGYVIAQEYLPAAAEGDVRMFMMNGQPLMYRKKYAVIRRARTGQDIRSNIHAGGHILPAEMTEDMHRIAEAVGPRLNEDGMFLVGLDIVGDKLMEINVFSPGGISDINGLKKVNFEEVIVDGIEQRFVQKQNSAA